jgi:hypothetical protein
MLAYRGNIASGEVRRARSRPCHNVLASSSRHAGQSIESLLSPLIKWHGMRIGEIAQPPKSSRYRGGNWHGGALACN